MEPTGSGGQKRARAMATQRGLPRNTGNTRNTHGGVKREGPVRPGAAHHGLPGFHGWNAAAVTAAPPGAVLDGNEGEFEQAAQVSRFPSYMEMFGPSCPAHKAEQGVRGGVPAK